MKQLREVLERLRDKKPGDKITVAVLRGKDKKEFTVTLARRPGGQQGGVGGPTAKRPYSFWYGGQRENVQRQQGPNGHEYGGVYKSTDGGETWARINSVNPRPMYFSQIRVDPSDDKYLYVLGISLYRSSDGGKTFRGDGNNGVHPDQHALWIYPRDGRHMIVGCDGGFYMTWDRMAHWDFLNHLAIGQFYHCCVDSRRPYRVYGGLQDNGSWGGPSHSLSGGILNEDWVTVLGGDGFVCRVDPTDPDIVYAESQDGNIARRNLRTGEFAAIRPRLKEGQPPYRFNWNTPFILSALPLGGPRQRPARHLPGNHADEARQRHRPGRVAAQPRRPLGRQRRRLPVGDARRRQGMGQRDQERRPAQTVLGGRH